MKIEESNIRREEVEKIVNYIKSKEYGTTIEFMELQQFTHYNLKDELEQYWFKSSIIAKVKKELISYGVVLKSVRYVGYYILKPNQISSYTYRTYIRKPLKSFERARLILANTNTKELNKNDVNEYYLTRELNNVLINKNNSIIEQEKYANLGKKEINVE